MRRRARALAGAAFGVADGTPADGDIGRDKAGGVDQFGRPAEAHKAFRAWYRARHPDAPKGIAAAAETIIGEWGPGLPLDERSFYACSPFRVAMTAHMIGNGYDPAYASRAIRVLPEWTQWCAQQSGLPDNLAAPSIAAARTAADKQDAEEQPDPTDTTPFRHQEWRDSLEFEHDVERLDDEGVRRAAGDRVEEPSWDWFAEQDRVGAVVDPALRVA
jgi:hypothetical protein